MKIQSNLVVFLAAALLVPMAHAQTAAAQTTMQRGQTQAQQAVPAVQAAAPLRKLGFRVVDWKTIHSKTEVEAQQDISTLKKIGCEVVSQQHENHIDIKYRCPQWKSIKLATDGLVAQWSQWCKTKGMETVVMNPPANTKKPTVRFRLANARNVHLHNPVEGQMIVNTLNLVGCNVTTKDHNGHMDATFDCPNWITIELETEESAHSWQKWFNDSGFETQHTHVK